MRRRIIAGIPLGFGLYLGVQLAGLAIKALQFAFMIIIQIAQH